MVLREVQLVSNEKNTIVDNNESTTLVIKSVNVEYNEYKVVINNEK
jgi:hypothetical protein